MLQFQWRSLALAAICFTFVNAAWGADITDYVPEQSLGFVVVRDLSTTNSRIESVIEIFKELSPTPLEGPLPMLKAASGLGAGVNESGDAALVLLPNEGETLEPAPLLMVAVSDYAAFAGSIQGDASGEICRVTIAGEEVLAAKLGDFVALMNVENRAKLEALLAAKPQAPASIAPMADWLKGNNVSVVAMPASVKLAAAQGAKGLDAEKAALAEQKVTAETAEMLEAAQSMMEVYQKVLGFLGAEIEAGGFGVAIDAETNIRLTGRVSFVKDGQVAKTEPVVAAKESPLQRFSDEPFVVAGGGPIPQQWLTAMAKSSRNMMGMFSKLYGTDAYTEEDWKEVEASWKGMLDSVISWSMILLPGESGDGLYSNVYFLVEVKDSKAYMQAYRDALAKWNGLVEKSKAELKLKYETTEVKIAGREGILSVVDIAAVVDDPNTAMVKQMMATMFGEDGKMRTYLVPLDDHTLVAAIAGEKQTTAYLERLANKTSSLADSEQTAATVKLLEPAAPWKGLVSPAGCVQWFSRFINQMMAQFGGAGPAIPEYPESPPVGLSLNLTEGQLRGEMVWPADSLRALAEFVKETSHL